MIKKQTLTDIVYLIAFLWMIGVLIVGGVILHSMSVFMLFFLAVMACFLVLTWKLYYAGKETHEISICLLLPVILSAFQNVYLGIFSPRLTSGNIQILLITNYLLGIGNLFLLLWKKNKKDTMINKRAVLILVLVVGMMGYGIYLYAIHSGVFISILSSVRNITSAFLFAALGILAVDYVDEKKFCNIFMMVLFLVILFGLYERLIDEDIWLKLNITDLWNKKGIGVAGSGLPGNFIAAEPINGQWLRRMTSTFADPVNLGTFLLAGVLITWYQKRYVLMTLTVLGCVLTISKGALLGIFIFAVIYAYYKMPKPIFSGLLVGCIVLGVAFLSYAYRANSSSVFIHIQGFFGAFAVLKGNCFGYGLGNVGTLSMFLGDIENHTGILESGLGMIMGQLGVLGFLFYLFFFGNLVVRIHHNKAQKRRILGISLVGAIFLNIMFNEVALSPNSNAIYFLVIGMLASQFEISKEVSGQEGTRQYNEELYDEGIFT